MKTLYILVGPPGSGKSWYARHELPGVFRVSQDEMGKRHLEEFGQAIAQGRDTVVDRMNFDRLQRARYIAAARKQGYRIVCVWFDVDAPVCLRRLASRKGHPTVAADADYEAIVGFYFKQLVEPAEDEYDELRVVTKRAYAKVADLRAECEGRRVIVVGDIHGCFDEFMDLLRKCGYSAGDVVVSVGDIPDRGPKVRECLEWFRDTPLAFSVEGNHCNRARLHWSGSKVKITHGLDGTIRQCEAMDHAALAAWMSAWPQIARVPDVRGLPVYVVHAGIDGRRPIGKQKVEDCLYARYLGGRDYFDDQGGEWWYHTLDGSFIVVSGHAVHENPRPTEFAYALDGGAFQGGKLRAMVIDDGRAEVLEVDSSVAVYSGAPKSPVQAREELVAEGMLRKDDLGYLSVYMYTDACVYARRWDDVTLNSRGHVFNRRTGERVAMSFPKFFNLGETPETQESVLPWSEGYMVFEKKDGWLGNLYRVPGGGYAVSTRGSFRSPGAKWATEFLRSRHDLSGLPDEITLVFELVSPITRIIVDYGETEELVLLSAFNRHTGEECDWAQVEGFARRYGFPLPRVYGNDISECRRLLAEASGRDMEGFVVRFASGLRVKIKGEDYLRRASIVSNLTPLSVWGAMSSGKVPQEYRDMVDADYREHLDSIASALEGAWECVRNEIEDDFRSVWRDGSEAEGRKEFAERVRSSGLRHRRVMFSRLDSKEAAIDRYAMAAIRPDNNELVAGRGLNKSA